MKPNTHVFTLVAVLALLSLGASCGDDGGSMSNQEVAEALLTTVFNDRDTRAFAQGVTDDYVHRQLGVPADAGGVASYYEGLLAENPALNLAIRRTIASGDQVLVHAQLTTAAEDVGNDRAGLAVAHLLELRDGLVAQQWVVTQEVPATSANPNTVFDGPVPGEGDAEESLALGMRFFDEFFVAQDLDSLNDFVRPSYIQHNPQVDDGIPAVQAFLGGALETFPGYTPRAGRWVAQGDFTAVLYQSALTPDAPNTTGLAIVDIWRTEDGEIVEHWDVIQFLDGTTPF
ncbi:MAG: nuclear transport factor 2 family protein [Myxococcota bacterium]